MKVYIVNYETDLIRDNSHWAFSNEEDAQKLAKSLIEGLKEREEIETTYNENEYSIMCYATFSEYVKINVEELHVNQNLTNYGN
jgi:hypothetical protein